MMERSRIKLNLEEKYRLVEIVNDLMSICEMNVIGIAEEVKEINGAGFDNICRTICIVYKELTGMLPSTARINREFSYKKYVERKKIELDIARSAKRIKYAARHNNGNLAGKINQNEGEDKENYRGVKIYKILKD